MSGSEEPPAKAPKVVVASGVNVTFVDWIITGGHYEGVVNLALGTIEHSLKDPDDEMAHVMITSRLRMTIPFAARLHAVLGDMLQGAYENAAPPSTGKMN